MTLIIHLAVGCLCFLPDHGCYLHSHRIAAYQVVVLGIRACVCEIRLESLCDS